MIVPLESHSGILSRHEGELERITQFVLNDECGKSEKVVWRY